MSAAPVYQVKQGPIRAKLMAEGGALALFDPKQRNTIVRIAMKAGGDFWVGTFLPKRFSQYAVSIGYRVSSRWRKYKEFQTGVAVPFVGLTPPGGGPRAPKWKNTNPQKMITAALAGSKATATATGNNARINISIPYGHAVLPETSEMFRTVPSWEMDRIADVVGARLQDLLDGLLPTIAITAPAPRSVSPPQARVTGVGSRRVGGAAARGTG